MTLPTKALAAIVGEDQTDHFVFVIIRVWCWMIRAYGAAGCHCFVCSDVLGHPIIIKWPLEEERKIVFIESERLVSLLGIPVAVRVECRVGG